MKERRIDIEGRDVTDFPGLWSDEDRIVPAMSAGSLESAEETYRLLGLAALALTDRIRFLLELKTKPKPERDWSHVGYMSEFIEKLADVADYIENR